MTIAFLLLVLVLLPLAALASARATPTDPQRLPDVAALHRQALIVHWVLAGAALATAATADLPLVWVTTPTPAAWLLAVLVVIGFLALSQLEARRSRPSPLREAFRAQPLDRWTLLVSLSAAISEELVYRGVLVLVLQAMLPLWAALAISAGAFACGHLAQGWRGALLAAGFALAMQGLLWFSGALLLPILAHLAYDLGAALIARRRFRQAR